MTYRVTAGAALEDAAEANRLFPYVRCRTECRRDARLVLKIRNNCLSGHRNDPPHPCVKSQQA